MTKTNKKTARKKTALPKNQNAPIETRVSESLTIFWAVSVLMLFVLNIVVVLAHFYMEANPDAEKMALLKGLLLFAGSLVGSVSLIVLPILYRVRRVPPPRGLAFFGACVSIAPILIFLAESSK